MILITNPIAVPNEISIIHSLFAEGLMLLHLRKPDYSEAEMKSFITAIGLKFNDRLVLHQQHHLAEELGIQRIHFQEKDRPHFQVGDAMLKSTSVHSIENFNALSQNYDYAFLSPLYPSISKPNYKPETNLFHKIKKRTNFKTQLVALGGIHAENIPEALANGFDDVALLGTIWNSNNPLENFKKCQQVALTF